MKKTENEFLQQMNTAGEARRTEGTITSAEPRSSLKVSNLDEYIKGMEEYTESVKNMSKEESIRALIRIGVLTPDGKPKKQICTRI